MTERERDIRWIRKEIWQLVDVLELRYRLQDIADVLIGVGMGYNSIARNPKWDGTHL